MSPWIGLKRTRKWLSDKAVLVQTAKLTPIRTPATHALG